MTAGPAKMRTTIVDTAYHYACEHGLSSLSIRTIAKECSVSVGSIYNYFPDKAALVTEVILKFWTTIAFSEETRTCLNYREGESLITFCERLYSTMKHALEQFRNNWLGEVSSLDARTRQKGRQAENACFEHIYHSLEKVIVSDKSINQQKLSAIDTAQLACFIWQSIYQALRNNDDCSTLFKLLKFALY